MVVFLTPGTWDVVTQISCPLARLQKSFASLLQEAEMVLPFLLVYATAVVLSTFNNTCDVVLFYRKFLIRERQLETQGNLCGIYFLCNSIYFQFLSLDLCLSSLPNLHQKKIVRSKGGSLMAKKAPKMFPIHHFNSFDLSSVMYAFLSKLPPDLARDCTLHFSNFLYYV